MERVINNEKDRFEALFEHASMGILVANAAGEIEMVNRYLLTQFGYDDSKELVGKQIEALIPKRYETKHHQHRGNYAKKPGPRSMGIGRELFALKKDGAEFPVEISLSNFSDKTGMFVIAFVIDITLRKEIEAAMQKQKALLEDKNEKIAELNSQLEDKVTSRTRELENALLKIEYSRDELKNALSKEKELGDLKSRFVSMASHEFRTPLSTILSSASLLAKYTQTAEQDKRDKHITRIKSSVNNLTDILNDFLSIGKMEDGKIDVRYTHFNAREFIQNICTEMQANAKTGQTILFNYTGEDWINMDMALLRNIIFNLLSNAIKFTNENGKITIKALANKPIFCLTITDTGIGVSTDDQRHLFERFFRAGNATNIQGTGLGLHIVQKYVELLNGHISFKSELEKGTSFTVNFQPITNK